MGGGLTSEQPIAVLSGFGYSITGTNKYYKIEGNGLYLTDEGVEYCVNNEPPQL